MVTRNRAPTHPGLILKELYLTPRNAKVTAFAEAAGLSRKHVSQVLNGHANVTPESAVRIAAVLGTTAQLWMNLQASYDLWHAERNLTAGKPVHARAFAAIENHAH